MKLVKYYLIIASLTLAGMQLHAQNKVGTVNISAVLSKLPELTQVQHLLEKYNKELSTNYEEKIATYKTKLDSYKKEESGYSDVMKKTKQQELLSIENDINKFRNNGTQLTQIRKDELLRPLYKKISDMVEVVAKEQNYSQILTIDGNEFAYANEQFDITKIVMDKLGIKAE